MWVGWICNFLQFVATAVTMAAASVQATTAAAIAVTAKQHNNGDFLFNVGRVA